MHVHLLDIPRLLLSVGLHLHNTEPSGETDKYAENLRVKRCKWADHAQKDDGTRVSLGMPEKKT